MSTLRERIKELSKSNGISLNKLEEKLGFAKGYISKLDKSTPSISNLKKIADYFGVSLDYLSTGKESSSVKNDASISLSQKKLLKYYKTLCV